MEECGGQELDIFLQNKVFEKLRLPKNVNNKICSPNPIVLTEKSRQPLI